MQGAPAVVLAPPRWCQAFVVAAFAWGTAGAAHLAAGGPPPGVVVTLALVAATSLLIWAGIPAAAARPEALTWGRLTGLSIMAQAAMHLLMLLADTWTQAQPFGGADLGSSSPAGTAAAYVHTMDHLGSMAAMQPMSAAAMPARAGHAAGHVMAMPLVPGPAMIAAHVCAAIIVAGAMAMAEQGLAAALRQLISRPVTLIFGWLLAAVRCLSGAAQAIAVRPVSPLLLSLPLPLPRVPVQVACDPWRGPPHAVLG